MKCMIKKMITLSVCAIFCVLLFVGCSDDTTKGTTNKNQANVELTEEQEKSIDIIMANKDVWGADVDGWPMNYIHISELESDSLGTMVFLSVAYYKPAESDNVYDYVFSAAHGYVVEDELYMTEGSHQDMLKDGLPIDLTTMSDEELREVITQSYKNYVATLTD